MLMQLLLTRMNHITQIISRTPIERQLHVLGVAHFILAAFAGVISTLTFISAIAFSTSMSGLIGGNVVDAFSFSRFVGVETALAGLALSGIVAAAGWNLMVQRWCKFGLALEVATLLLFPFGTVLGVATLFVLAQGPVRERFGEVCHPVSAR